MAAASGSTLALAARLRALDDSALSELVARRGVRDSGIRDFFDLAEALLDRGSVQSALERLDRRTLALLAAAAEHAEHGGAPTAAELATRLAIPMGEARERIAIAVDAGLLGAESGRYAPWDAVVEQLRAWPAFGLPSLSDLIAGTPPAALDAVSDTDARFVDRGASDRAFHTLTAVEELVLAIREHPARQLARGGIALPDLRRLAAVAGLEADEVEPVLAIAALADLVEVRAGERVATEAALEWLDTPRPDRWRALAAGWLALLPADLRDVLADRARATWGHGLLEYLDWLYPGGGGWIRERAAEAARGAEQLGISAAATPSSPGTALLTDGPDAAAAAMGALFPADVDRVYLQHDLTVVAPGPLRADLDLRLRRVAEVETRGLASTFRITALALDRALLAGETAESIQDFLASISLTGIPQPVEYLIADTAARFGSLRVGALPTPDENARSYVRSADAGLIGQLEVDQALAPLALVRTGEHRLVSRFDASLLYSSLLDARYAVVAEDEGGNLIRLLPDRRAVGDTTPSLDTAAILVARVRAGAATTPVETDRAWLARQLELAIKGKVTVTVSVRMPDDTIADYLLEPASLAGGRLRARDRRADIERTLPLSSIVAISSD